jgi:hypothetical protein
MLSKFWKFQVKIIVFMEVVLLNGGVRNLKSPIVGVGRSDLRSLHCPFRYNIWISSWIANSTSLTIFEDLSKTQTFVNGEHVVIIFF